MNLLLLGATGKTGSEVLKQAIVAGHTITILVRSTSKLPKESAGVRVIIGDATDENAMKVALEGNEALISTIGAVNSSVITRSTRALISAARYTQLRRVIILSSFAVNQDKLTRSARLLTGLVMKRIIEDKQSGEALLRTSGLDWTIVHATTLTNTAKKAPVHVIPSGERVGLTHSVSRQGVASWILDELMNSSYLNRDVTISQ